MLILGPTKRSFPLVVQQSGKGVHPGLAQGSTFGLTPLFIWLSPQLMLASKFDFTCNNNYDDRDNKVHLEMHARVRE